jgi:hypothetical protein
LRASCTSTKTTFITSKLTFRRETPHLCDWSAYFPAEAERNGPSPRCPRSSSHRFNHKTNCGEAA